MAEPRHSETYLTDQRDGWWNADWLALMARRLDLGRVRRALDVGSGQGHWTRTLRPHLHPDAEFDGVEREPDWVAIANARARPGMRTTVGTAEALPFPDGSFDLVTCQTLLIHVPDPARVLREMWRVLRPGGRVLLAEPNNLPGVSFCFAALPDGDIDDLLDAVRLEATIERGKRALGEGYNSLGEELIGLLGAGWVERDAWINDRARKLCPPYDLGLVEEERRFYERGEIGWTRAEALRYFLAADADEARFDRGWAATLRINGARLAAVDAGTYAAADGSPLYLVTARKEGP